MAKYIPSSPKYHSMSPVKSWHLHVALQTLSTRKWEHESLRWMWSLVLTTRGRWKMILVAGQLHAREQCGHPGCQQQPTLLFIFNIIIVMPRRVTLNINIARGTTYPEIDSVTRVIVIEYSATWIICKFGHQVAPLAWLQLVTEFAINEITPGHGVDFWVRCASGNDSNFGHQVALHALVVNLSKSWHLKH